MAAPRTQFYHPAPVIDAALKSIERCVRRGEGMALVVGPPGTGKSLLLAMVAEHVRDDFDVALLSGASICTRRALWQSILAEIGEPFRGIDEADLRMAVVERIRGLAATGSGLVILVDEATTLPTRLVEELRLLTNVPTPLPAVHIVLAGGLRLEEMLAAPRMESLAQRIAVRGYLEPLDHAETMAYLRTQTKAAGLAWDELFAPGSDDAVFKATDGVPRLVNQLCDQALVLVAECGRAVTAADIAAAWREIQRLPVPPGVEQRPAGPWPESAVSGPGGTDPAVEHELGEAMEVIEFGAGSPGTIDSADPWSGPEVEVASGHGDDPFESMFPDDAPSAAARVGGPDDFRRRPHVASREGSAIGRVLASLADAAATVASPGAPPAIDVPAVPPAAESRGGHPDSGDSDMVLVVDDADESEPVAGRVTPVRPADYGSLFTRLRHGSPR